PEKYWKKALHDSPVVIDDGDVERLIAGDGRCVVHKNTVGELLCALLTDDSEKELNIMASSMASYWTNDAATGWGGDRFYLLAEGSDTKAAAKELKGLRGVWIKAWDTPEDRVEFVDDYLTERTLLSRRSFKLSPSVHVFTFGFDERQEADLEAKFHEHPPAMKKDGKSWPQVR